MDLFNKVETLGLLPYDGTAIYHPRAISPDEATAYFLRLMDNIDWKNDEAVIFGRHIVTRRKVAWYGDRPYGYTYSNTTKQALPWTPDLLRLKQIAEAVSACTFNSCLLNLYHNGDEGMAWHSDDERSLGKDTTIASLSLGAERRFCFRHKLSRQQHEICLANGSILLMMGTTQTNWLHSLPKAKKVITPRINLTFRTMTEQGE